MIEIFRLATFAAFLALGVRIRAARDEGERPRRIRQFLVYVLALSLMAGVTQWDDWPFTNYRLAAFRARVDTPLCLTDFEGIDARGREWRLDPYSFSPVYLSVLQYWFDAHLEDLGADERDRVLAFVLERAEESRRRQARGQRIGYERILGPAHARFWWLLPRATEVSADPFTGLRVYRECWIPRARFQAGGGVTRSLTAQVYR